MPFRDRSDAGCRLARALAHDGQEAAVVLALPRGGVPIAAEVASELRATLDPMLVRKQPELAMGAIVDGNPPIIVRNEHVIGAARVSKAVFDRACRVELAEIERRRTHYLGNRMTVDIEARTIIVIDDGLATGATMRAALRALRKRNPKKIVLAVPVAPIETLDEMRPQADEVICLEAYELFGVIGAYYDDFRQVTDEELIATLARSSMATAVSTGRAAT
ncbi:Predicted phosphoribosyltransferase [Rhizobiales bacterium GAS113]|nr:Predicted phosphoribosyltransferase [Rhizobiales bacterium GAS113]